MLKAKLNRYLQSPGATADNPKTFSEGLVHENHLANVVIFRGTIPKSSVTTFDKKSKSQIDLISLKNDFVYEETGKLMTI